MQRVLSDDLLSKQPEEILAERERLASLSSAVSTALVKGHNLQETLQRCCKAIVDILDAAFARIWTLNSETDILELQASQGMYTHLDGEHSRIPVGKFKIGLIAQEREPHLTNSVIGDPRVRNQEWAKREGIVSFAGYPLIVENKLVGIIALFARKPLSDATIRALAVVADGVALGIERHRSEQQLKEQTEVVETINRIGRILSAELNHQKLVQSVTDEATKLIGAQFGAFFYNVYDNRGESFMLYTLSGVPLDAFSNFPMPRATDLFGPTFRGEATIRSSNIKKDPRYGKLEPYYGMPEGHLPVTSYLAVSVVSRYGDVIGGLFFGHSDENVFTERDEQIIEGIAAQTAIAMDNAKLYQEAQQAIKERDELLLREQTARREAEAANRAKDEFLGLLSHELRTPLNAILGWTRLLTSGNLDKETFDKAINTIDRNSTLQARLIDDMLDLSRIISGQLRLDAQPVDLTRVINAAVDTSLPAADAKGIKINIVLDYGAGLVLGDSVRLQQVIWNLLSNAIKFTPKNGKIQIQLERVNSHVEVTVSDTGMGIDEDFLPYIFDRFRQADSTSTKKFGGLGLGLAIARHIIELHGGTIEADNRQDAQGAIFTITLPVMIIRKTKGQLNAETERVHPTVSETIQYVNMPSLEGIKILAVDDEADARLLLSTVLEKCGANVKTCASAAEAISILEEDKPDVLISDIGMPEMDGYLFIEKVRETEAKSGMQIQAVALTAFARVEDRLKALSAGYNMHVPKPVEPLELAVVISSLINRSKKTS